ncbi:nuclear transport factor 2 family protein [uncultured Psychroserpens sp.]|uniref:nuclear transport factor 2 family protein n=1 Tax=uncultured Psychroserpens sp. TaxID=255436 RepID=UPI0026277243|nr:nuclear transport factor 2 family protein [uncultured Psychroserpens sp.]
MKIHLYILILGLVIFGCNTPQTKTSNEDTAKLESFITQYYSVMSERDWNTYRQFFADKAILTTIWHGPNDPKPTLFSNSITEFLAQTKNGPDNQPIFEEKPLTITTDIKNDLASVWVKYTAKFGTESNLMQWQGYDVFSLIKFENKWHITSITYLSIESE